MCNLSTYILINHKNWPLHELKGVKKKKEDEGEDEQTKKGAKVAFILFSTQMFRIYYSCAVGASVPDGACRLVDT